MMLEKKSNSSIEVKQNFIAYDRQSRIKSSKIAAIVLAILMPVGIILDYFVYPTHLWSFFKMRLLCSVLSGALWIFFKTPFGQKHDKITSVGWAILPSFFICWMIAVTEGAVSPYYAGLILILLMINTVVHWAIRESLIAIVILIGMYAGACFVRGPIENIGIFVNNLYFLFLSSMIVIIGNYFYNRLRFQEFELRHKLLEMDKAKTRFFANISHELRTPLTLLLAPLNQLRQRKDVLIDSETNDQLNLMYANAMRLLKLINDLLDLVKLEAGRLEIKREPVNIKTVIKGLVNSIQGTAKEKAIKMESYIQEDIGTILVDADKLEKIMLNLIFNAVKFTSKGGSIKIWAQKQDDQLFLKVQDTGIGISKSHLPFIFDRFWQGDGSAKRKYQGTGIGLSLVKELTEAQGGSIAAESEEGKGTVVMVTLPYQRAVSSKSNSIEEEHPLMEKNAERTALYREAERFPGRMSVSKIFLAEDVKTDPRQSKILVVDDEPDMLRFLRLEISRNHQVSEATDGQQAIDKAKELLPDLIILDMMMPEKDGIEVCRELREDPATKSIPILLLTDRADEEIKIKALLAGATDFATKPFSMSELNVRIKNLLKSYQLQHELSKQNQVLEKTLKELKEIETQLIQTEKLASLGRVSAGIIHEINNPLNFFSSIIYILRKKQALLPEHEQETYHRNIQDIEEGLDRVKQIVSELRTFSHPASGPFNRVKVTELVTLALRFLSDQWKDQVEMKVEVLEEHIVWGYKNHLVQVLLNLVQNALDAVKRKERVREKPTVWIQSHAQDDYLHLIVRDNGDGIPKEHRDKIFEPFFTMKDVGEGLGMGLSVCYRVIQQHKGRILLESEVGKFAEFIIELPLDGNIKSKMAALNNDKELSMKGEQS